MKQLISILLLFVIVNLHAQVCCVPQTLREKYDRDVKHLVLLRMELFNSPSLNEIDISQTWQDSIWQGLAAIFHSNSPGRNAVFNAYCIHHDDWNSQDYPRVPNSIYVRLDPAAPWFANWVGGSISTNVPFLDSLLAKHGFETVNFAFQFINVFRLTTSKNINLKPLCILLEQSNEIIYAEPVPGVGGSQRITYNRMNGGSRFDFYQGWDDCPSGCISWYIWSFFVDDFCNAIYLGGSGSSSLPAPPNCNDFVDPSPNIKIEGSFEICQGDNSTLTVVGGESYLWNTGDSTASITISPAVGETYRVTVTASDGCMYEKSVLIHVNPIPAVSLSLLRDTFCVNETAIMLTGGTPVGGSYIGAAVVGDIFELSVAGVGTHLIGYTFTDAEGCTGNAAQTVVVEAGNCFSNAENLAVNSVLRISPNPSTGNFTILQEPLSTPFQIQVFNSQGQMVYSGYQSSNQVALSILPKGAYLIKILNEKSVRSARLLIR